jgi:hypothetical protein
VRADSAVGRLHDPRVDPPVQGPGGHVDRARGLFGRRELRRHSHGRIMARVQRPTPTQLSAASSAVIPSAVITAVRVPQGARARRTGGERLGGAARRGVGGQLRQQPDTIGQDVTVSGSLVVTGASDTPTASMAKLKPLGA